ncbi:MAG: peptide-N-glycosidase F-related protein [Nannocystales bacterium]
MEHPRFGLKFAGFVGAASAAALLASCTSVSEPSALGGTTTTSDEATGSGTTEAEGRDASSDASSADSGSDAGSSSTGVEPLQPTDMLLMDSVVFYDGYAETVDEPTAKGIIRINNAVQTIRLTEAQLDLIQPNLEAQVLIGALCDNYDRLGSVNLALTPKGLDTYEPSEVDRIEVGRFVTPFMDMNRQPDTVRYNWDIDEVAAILTDPALREAHDFWFELEVFGVPYAANTEISGCEGRNDVFRGWLGLHTSSSDEPLGFTTFMPLAMQAAFNNYQEDASDALGTTTKTIEFELENDTEYAQLVLITSNHGANAGGEEYIRREHFVTLDGRPALEYTPGRDTCEPFREVNTQGNGIYGPSPMTDEEWQSFSNWCPGDVIDTRIIEWGALPAGLHTFVIDVPDAEFADAQGNFPLSLYLQAR